ncbi:hypothetical protein [Streptomyces sp. NBC_00827]|uniref:hypothetical protein n=1 Tax=Streptomyces sp. NBC_00827 TaxID=2903677 RepID=UPI003866F542|nr:hypothetical protein OG569_02285 [Streptomyces sp. NBC_00827]
MRRDVELQIITEALQKMGPHSPATRIWGRAPGATSEQGAAGNVWAGDVHDVAVHIATRLYGHPSATTAAASPRAQAEDAKRARDLVGEIGALMQGDEALTSAPWYPARRGDVVLVHYEQAGEFPAFGETYVVDDADGGLLGMRLLAHTLPDTMDPAEVEGMAGCFAVESADCPLYEVWFEAGPQRLTIVRDGRVVHAGGAR